MTEPSKKLHDDVIYYAYDRFVCSNTHCAGATALYTGKSLDGHRLRKIDQRDRDEWATYGLGPIRCECGHLTDGGAA